MALLTARMNGIVGLGAALCGGLVIAASGCGSSSAKTSDSGTDGKDASLGFEFPSCTPTVVARMQDGTGANIPYLVSDFTYVDGSRPDAISWGDYTFNFSGYSYFYPDNGLGLADPTNFGTSDVTGGAWHLMGTVRDYTGFGIGFACQSDASMFTGVSFTIKGNAGTPNQLVFAVGTSPNAAGTIPGEAGLDGAATWGRCVPRANQYDGTCVTPTKTITLGAGPDPVTVKVRWADLTGGKPQNSVSPSQVLGLTWAFTWNAGSSAPYPVDITIDDVMFTID